MRHLIVCCDGTWQTTISDSNVVRLRRALLGRTGDGVEQLHTYVPGVGTTGLALARLTGGATGWGLSATVLEGYRWLAETYRAGDVVALFGFSRGAYTARSLAGLVGRCGLLDLRDAEDVDAQLATVYRRYRTWAQAPEDRTWATGLSFHVDERADDLPIRFIGVWDTVGSLGIPDHLRVGTMFDAADHRFHDVRLDPRIEHARHAIALDEQRGPFSPTRWCDPLPGQDVKEVWFPGTHLDVGGGGFGRGLSDGALRWMMDEAESAIAVEFDPDVRGRYRPDPLAVANPLLRFADHVQHEFTDVLLTPSPRAIPRIDAADRTPDVHESAYRRQAAQELAGGRYRPTATPGAGGSATVAVPANDGWVATGLWLEPGEYSFAATGGWRSVLTPVDPAGNGGAGSIGRLVGSTIDRFAGSFRRVVQNPVATVIGARREPNLPWMSLVGYVANETRNADGTINEGHERIAIGAGTSHVVQRPGYLYAFANVAWGGYPTNSGAVELTVRRSGGTADVDAAPNAAASPTRG